jgi:exopolysaccharide biosynthesis WecB/TagA/CpsF family protein
MDSLAIGAKQKRLKTPSGHIRYLDTAGFAIRRAYVEGHSPLFNVSDVRGSDTTLLAKLCAEKLLPCFVESARVEHHPVQSLPRYLLRHVRIGYFTSPARARLRASTDFLLTGARRAGVLCSAWTDSSKCRLGRLAFFLLLAAYVLEVLGRITYRAVGMRSGRTDIFGTQVECLDSVELQSRILSATEQHRSACVTYLTAWSLVQIQRNHQFKQLLGKFDIRYADGFGVVLAALLLNARRIRKVTANDFFFPMCREIARRRLTLALVGGEPQVIRKASERLAEKIPGIQIGLSLPGYLSLEEEERLQRSIAESRPDIVILGMGQPRQEQLALRLRDAGAETVFLCVGGLFDYIAGRIATPPAVIRRCGFEWLWKLGYAPHRYWRRYVIGIPALGIYILREHLIRLKAFVSSRGHNKTGDQGA